MITLEGTRPWLHMRFDQELRVLSFAPWRPGFVQARGVCWREVRDADLGPDFDVDHWLLQEMPHDSVGFLTSRNVSKHHQAKACVEGIEVISVATVGLSNVETVGKRQSIAKFGTINIAVFTPPLTETAQIEALSIATEARTAAVIAANVPLNTVQTTDVATGTGTDCIAIAAPDGVLRYAGKHTALGEAIGRAVYDSVAEGVERWRAKKVFG